jgi:hypothetical protein
VKKLFARRAMLYRSRTGSFFSLQLSALHIARVCPRRLTPAAADAKNISEGSLKFPDENNE